MALTDTEEAAVRQILAAVDGFSGEDIRRTLLVGKLTTEAALLDAEIARQQGEKEKAVSDANAAVGELVKKKQAKAAEVQKLLGTLAQ